MQVEPVKPKLKAPGTKRLKLYYDKLPSSFAFNFNLRRYTSAARCSAAGSGLNGAVAGNWMRFYIEARDEFDNVITTGRGLHSSTFRLDLSRFCLRNHQTYSSNSAYAELKSGRV